MVKIVFCLPGKTYSRDFLLCWTDLMMQVASKGHQAMVSQQPTRAECLAFCSGDYEVAMWIDQDVIFRPSDFFDLLESPHDVTAGLYARDPTPSNPAPEFTAVKDGSYLKPDDSHEDQYVQVEKTGLGWVLIRRGVLEAIEGPPFWSTEPMSDEDAFAKNVTAAGVPIYVDTKMRVGSQKFLVI